MTKRFIGITSIAFSIIIAIVAIYLLIIQNYIAGFVVGVLNALAFYFAGNYLLKTSGKATIKTKKSQTKTHPIIMGSLFYFILATINSTIIIKYYPMALRKPSNGFIFHGTNIAISILAGYLYYKYKKRGQIRDANEYELTKRADLSKNDSLPINPKTGLPINLPTDDKNE